MKTEFLLSKLPEGGAFVVENPLNLRYITNSDITEAVLILTKEKSVFLTDSRYIESAQNQIGGGIEVVLLTSRAEQLKQLLSGMTVYLETEFQTISSAKVYPNVADSNLLDKILGEARSVKSAEEIELIKKAQSLTDGAFAHVCGFIKEGITEKELALEIEWFMRKGGAAAVSFDLIAISGKKTSLPHGIPSDKKIEAGDFITMDIGCKVGGYCSDMTRTVAIGKADDKMKEIYSIVLSAQSAALAAVCAGAAASDVDKAARDIITQAGYGACFGHGTGHGVGLYIHELPTVSYRSKAVLKPGNVITIEPGIYLPGQFGVRIEDMVVVTESGCDNLTKSPKELIII